MADSTFDPDLPPTARAIAANALRESGGDLHLALLRVARTAAFYEEKVSAGYVRRPPQREPDRTDAIIPAEGPPVCNDFGNHIPYHAYVEEFSHIRLPLVFPEAAPNLEPRDDIWPSETAPIIRRHEGGVELAQLRWGLAPNHPKGRLVINFRSEGRRFERGRCLVPASHFFEFTGAKAPKAKWKFTKAGEDWFCFAGLWRPATDGAPESFTLLTCPPGPDVAPIHPRQMVVLDRADWAAWLDLTKPESELLRPLPEGSLRVERVR